MRIPYIPDPPTGSGEASEVADRIRARRAPQPLQALDLALLNAPAVADGWNAFLGAIRTQTVLPAAVRELLICRVAVVNGAWYEWDQHAPLAVAAGVGDAVLGLVKRERAFVLDGDGPLGQGAEEREEREQADGGKLWRGLGFDEMLWVVLCFADEMTRHVKVRDATFERLRGLFCEREVVEIVATIACYNCVSRFLVALDVGEKNGTGPDALL